MLDTVKTTKLVLDKNERIAELEEENKRLKEFKAKQEEMMFLIGASIELAHPKTYRDAEKLQKGKEIYEKLYKEELYYLREENKRLKSDLSYERTMLDNVKAEYENLQEINEKLKEKTEKLEKELSAVYKAYHTAMGVDYIDADLYDLDC